MLEVFNPTGAAGVTSPFAPRLETMHNKKIGLLSNGLWQAHRTLPLLQDTLGQQYPRSTFEVIPGNEAIQDDKTIDAIAGLEYDAVIVGNAA
jgi:hypothetical protein